MQKKILKILLFLFFVSGIQAQEKKTNPADEALKEAIYSQNKKAVLNYNIKQFDALFFEFFDKKRDPNVVLTKEEFYNYTMKIAVFSERLASLYPEQKQVAEDSKKKWMAENYEDYLLSKEIPKK